VENVFAVCDSDGVVGLDVAETDNAFGFGLVGLFFVGEVAADILMRKDIGSCCNWEIVLDLYSC
jgi:hypothetical protein